MLISPFREFCMYRYIIVRFLPRYLLTLIKYVDLRVFRAALKRVCDDFVGRGHYTRNYTSALITR